jgi:hypothetical protein
MTIYLSQLGGDKSVLMVISHPCALFHSRELALCFFLIHTYNALLTSYHSMPSPMTYFPTLRKRQLPSFWHFMTKMMIDLELKRQTSER